MTRSILLVAPLALVLGAGVANAQAQTPTQAQTLVQQVPETGH